MIDCAECAETANQLATRLRELHRLHLRRHDSFLSRYRDYLETGCRLLGMDTGVVSRIQGERYEVLAVVSESADMVPGDALPLVETYCSRVIDTGLTVTIAAAGLDPVLSGHAMYHRLGFDSYAAAPIWVFDRIYGTLSFTARASRPRGFTPADTEVLEMMALSLGRIIERDLTERERAAALARMHENIELFESAFRYAAIGKALVSLEGQWLRVNQALVDLLGYSEAELLAVDFQRLTHPDDLSLDLELLEEMLAGKRSTFRMEKRYLHKRGHVVWVLLSVSMARYANGRPRYFVSQIQDITPQKQAQRRLETANRRLEALAAIDELTGISNRRAFDRELAQEVAHHRRSRGALSLLIVDVDRFKHYNDDFGHQAGDGALRAVARAIEDNAREHDKVARYGGEEFAVILPETGAGDCMQVAERVRAAIAAISGLRRRVTCSVGGHTLQSGTGDVAGTAEHLLSCADRALYLAKTAGRDRACHFDDEAESRQCATPPGALAVTSR